MNFQSYTVEEYLAALSARDAVPGGGGAASVAGALAASLASMVGNLTVGKKKYAQYEVRVTELIGQSAELRDRFLALSDEDAAAFLPLSKAYSMPKETEEDKRARDAVMQPALEGAAEVPLALMECCANTLKLLEELLEKGSTLAVSDVGVAATLCRAALEGAALNVYINTKLIKDKPVAEALNQKAERLLDDYLPKAEDIYIAVLGRLK